MSQPAPINPKRISLIRDIWINDITQPDPDEDTLLGICWIMGVSHHAEFIRVDEDDDGHQMPVRDPLGRYDDMQRYYDGEYCPIQVPGFPGWYVVMIHPYAY